MTLIIFPGNDVERTALLVAVERYCGCDREESVVRARCGAHSLLLSDATLKHLIFFRRWQRALRRGEWLQDPAWAHDRAGTEERAA